MKLLAFLTREAKDAPHGSILAMTATSGVAAGLLLVLINMGAETVADDGFNPMLMLLYLIVFGVMLAARSFALVQSVEAVERAVHRFRLRVIDKIRRADLRFIEEHGGIATYTPLTRDINLVSQAIMFLVPTVEAMIVLLITGIYLAWLSPASLLVILAIYGVMLLVYFTRYSMMSKTLSQATELDAEFFERFTGLLGGFKELKLNRAESDALFEHLRTISSNAFRRKLAAAESQSVNIIFSSSILYAMLFAVVFTIPTLVPEASNTIHNVIAAVLFMMSPLGYVVGGAPTLAKVGSAVANLYALEEGLDQAAMHADAPLPAEPLAGFDTIELKELSFHYADREGQSVFEVGPCNLDLRRGEFLFIVGGNGSGKSTLLKLLTGLYRPDHGQILLNGHSVSHEDQPRYRSLFTSVFTDFHLFERLYGTPGVTPSIVNAKIAELGLAHKTRYTDQGFTNLDLSTGQKKRLAFIGSVLKNRPICVFDELAADQDPQFRRRFYEQILPDLRLLGLTLVVVSHDDRYFHTADRVLRLCDGQFAEIDRHVSDRHREL